MWDNWQDIMYILFHLLLQFSLRLHCNGIRLIESSPLAKSRIPSWHNLHVLTYFAVNAKYWAELLPFVRSAGYFSYQPESGCAAKSNGIRPIRSSFLAKAGCMTSAVTYTNYGYGICNSLFKYIVYVTACINYRYHIK